MGETIPIASEYTHEAVKRLNDFSRWLTSSYATNVITASEFTFSSASIVNYCYKLISIYDEIAQEREQLMNL